MSRSQVFVATNESLHDFVAHLQPLLGVDFVFIRDPGPHRSLDRYEAATGGLRLFVVSAEDFENDRDMDFESYQLYVGVDGCGTQRHAQRVFDALKASRRYRLMLTEEVQRKLAEFEP